MRSLLCAVCALALTASASTRDAELEKARDAQDRAALQKLVTQLEANVAKKPGDRPAQLRLALAQSFLSEVALEQRDKTLARAAAESGIRAAEKAVELDPKPADGHTVLGTLCAQVIPANVLAGLKYGRCAMDEINKAIQIDPRSSDAWLRHGVGNYYLPVSFGGGIDKALADFAKAIQLDGKSAEAHLWRGIALRKANRHADARQALEQALKLNPNRLWAKQQLEKTPAQ
jgi:tetratricopeptide (TPR) repeat protein